MIISGNCSIVIKEDIVSVSKIPNSLLIQTAYDQQILLTEQGYLKLEAFFAGRKEKDPDIEQMKKNIERHAYVKGYDDGYQVGTSINYDRL